MRSLLLGLVAACAGCTGEGRPGSGVKSTATDSAQHSDSAPPLDSGGDEAFLPPAARSCLPLRLSLRQQLDGLGSPTQVALARDALPGPGLALGDVDGDGWLDAVLARPGLPALLLRGDGLQLTATEELPPGEAVALGDLDGDGTLEIVLAGSGEDVLLRSTPEGFAASTLPQAERHTASMAPFDADGDGDLDLFAARHAWPAELDRLEAGDWPGDGHSLLLNDGSGSFSVAPDSLGTVARGLGFHGAPVDVEQDGDLDIYLNHDFGSLTQANRMLVNDGDGLLTPRTEDGTDLAMFAMGTSVADVSGDGLPDLFVTNLRVPVLLASLGDGQFVEAGAAAGLPELQASDREASWGSRFVDVDGDGDDDLVVGFSAVPATLPPDGVVTGRLAQRDAVLLQTADGRFVDAELEGAEVWEFAAPGGTKAVLTADLDADGRPELLTVGYLPSYDDLLLQVWTLEGGCGLGITLRFPLDARSIGARVEVEVGGQSFHRWMLPSGLYGASAPEVYLGLGEAGYATRVEVHLLDGRSLRWDNVLAGTLLELSEAD